MRRWLVLAALLVAPALAAQQPGDTGEATRLRNDIERAYGEHVRQVLGLSDDQAAKLRSTQERFRTRRQSIRQEQLTLRSALAEQMRPGVAANGDSVRGLMERIHANRLSQVQLEQEEDREMAGYLTPVQRAQYQLLRERLMQRVAQERNQRGLQTPPRAREQPQGETGRGLRQPPPRQRRPL